MPDPLIAYFLVGATVGVGGAWASRLLWDATGWRRDSSPDPRAESTRNVLDVGGGHLVPDRIPECAHERARLNLEWEQTIRELRELELFPEPTFTSGFREPIPGRMYFEWKERDPMKPRKRVRKKVAVFKDGSIKSVMRQGRQVTIPSGPAMLYTEYLQRWPEAPALLPELRRRVEDRQELELVREVDAEISGL